MGREKEWLDVFGDMLAKMIYEAGYTQEEFANKAGLSPATVSNYVNKKQLPGIKALAKISYVFGLDVNDLVNFDGIRD